MQQVQRATSRNSYMQYMATELPLEHSAIDTGLARMPILIDIVQSHAVLRGKVWHDVRSAWLLLQLQC